jgi:hypothetical protein
MLERLSNAVPVLPTILHGALKSQRAIYCSSQAANSIEL